MEFGDMQEIIMLRGDCDQSKCKIKRYKNPKQQKRTPLVDAKIDSKDE